MRRSLGRGRSPALTDDLDDPLASMVNLFDIAMIFAVALVVALVFANDVPQALTGSEPVRALPDPGSAAAAPSGGESVGRVLRLPDGSLVYTLSNDQEGSP